MPIPLRRQQRAASTSGDILHQDAESPTNVKCDLYECFAQSSCSYLSGVPLLRYMSYEMYNSLSPTIGCFPIRLAM